MFENSFDHSSATDEAAEVAYWEAEGRRWDYAAYVEQQALSLAGEGDLDSELED